MEASTTTDRGSFTGYPEFNVVYDELIALVNKGLERDGYGAGVVGPNIASESEAHGYTDAAGRRVVVCGKNHYHPVSKRTWKLARLLGRFCEAQRSIGIQDGGDHLPVRYGPPIDDVTTF
jgi:hypothetical protein